MRENKDELAYSANHVYRAGYEDGYHDGYGIGYEIGYSDGYNKAVKLIRDIAQEHLEDCEDIGISPSYEWLICRLGELIYE